jgi:hypothetical protein
MFDDTETMVTSENKMGHIQNVSLPFGCCFHSTTVHMGSLVLQVEDMVREMKSITDK